jgi:hypothetical protein
MTMAKKKAYIPPPPGPEASADELAAYVEKYGLDELEAAGYIQDLTEDEKKDMDDLAVYTRSRVEARKTARTQLNLALSAEQLSRFTQYAQKRHIPPSTLAKSWLLERLDQEAKEA